MVRQWLIELFGNMQVTWNTDITLTCWAWEPRSTARIAICKLGLARGLPRLVGAIPSKPERGKTVVYKGIGVRSLPVSSWFSIVKWYQCPQLAEPFYKRRWTPWTSTCLNLKVKLTRFSGVGILLLIPYLTL